MKYERFKIIGEVFQPNPTGLLYYYLSICSAALTNMIQVTLCLTIRLSLSKYKSGITNGETIWYQKWY